jgi:hypothetical protein
VTPFLTNPLYLRPACATQVPFAEQIRAAVPGLPIGAVGLITEPKQGESWKGPSSRLKPLLKASIRVIAEQIVSEGKADGVFLARELLRDADFLLKAADEFGAVVSLCVFLALFQCDLQRSYITLFYSFPFATFDQQPGAIPAGPDEDVCSLSDTKRHQDEQSFRTT